ncbi:hypothetical protein ACTXT7_003309 [Hymenolepis weldensis]
MKATDKKIRLAGPTGFHERSRDTLFSSEMDFSQKIFGALMGFIPDTLNYRSLDFYALTWILRTATEANIAAPSEQSGSQSFITNSITYN